MPNVRPLVLTAIFIALAIAGGLALIAIPNVELITVTVFLAGFMLGAWRGMMVGAIAEFLYSFFNPYGVAAPPVLIAQVLSMALAGCGGSGLRFFCRERIPAAWLCALSGLLLTLIFDLATTVGFLLITDQGLAGMLAALTFGLYFYLTHLTSNTLLFAVLLPILIPRLQTLTIFRNLPRAQAVSDRNVSRRAVAAAHLQSESASQDRRHSAFD